MQIIIDGSELNWSGILLNFNLVNITVITVNIALYCFILLALFCMLFIVQLLDVECVVFFNDGSRNMNNFW